MTLSKLRVHSFAVSIDGFGAGPNQDLQNPLGVGRPGALRLVLPHADLPTDARTGDGETGADDAIAAKGFENFGAWILGRNMFGPIRGPWPDESWKGWWGEEPPYHVPVFVLTHHARAPIPMKGGTEFRFVTDGIHAALERRGRRRAARTSAWAAASRRSGSTCEARLIDELHLAIAPVLLGAGENLLAGLDLRALGYECVEHLAGERAAAHVILRKTDRP